MKIFIRILGLLAAIVVAAVLLIPLFVSTDKLVQPIAGQVRSATGRELFIDGDSSLSIFPALSLQLNQVRLSNMATGSRPDMIKMQQLDVHIPWMSLLAGELRVEKFVIRAPDILLETDSDGTANWDMLGATEPDAPLVEEDARRGLPAGFDLNLANVAIEGGTLTYIDGQAGSQQRVEHLGLSISLPSLRESLHINGSITYLDVPFTISLAVTTPARAISGQAFELSAGVKSHLVSMNYAGGVSDEGAVSGTLKLNADSVKELLDWQEIDIETRDQALNKLQLSAEMLYRDNALALSQLNLQLDALRITGDSTITLAEVPLIAADVDLGLLDINPYLPAQTPAQASSGSPGPTPGAGANPPAQPLVWDSTPIDLSGLQALNAKITLRSTGIVFQDIKLGASEVSLVLDAGRADIALTKFDAYEGKGEGTVSINARSTPYKIDTRFTLSGIKAQPLLTHVTGFDKLQGSGRLNWQLKTAGVSQKDFIGALNGKLEFSFTDGAVKGANIAQLLRGAGSILKGDITGTDLSRSFDNAAATDFSELAGSMQFSSGIGKNNDLMLVSPLLRVTGNGELDLPAAKIDYSVNARLVSSIEGQGGGKAKGVAIPIRIRGPLHDVKIKPDYSKAAEAEVKDRLQDKLKKFLTN